MNNILDYIDARELGIELKKARERSGLTQKEASEIIDVARTTITAIEKGERKIKSSELVRLARAYGRTVGDFVRKERPIVRELVPEFRTAYRESGDTEPISEQIVEEFMQLCSDYVELENITNDPLPYQYPDEYRVFDHRIDQQAEVIAYQERQRLGLGDSPVAELRTLLEREVGLRIFYLKLRPSYYAGIYVFDENLGGCIAINRDQIPERRRWNLAHEYAHFLAHRHQIDLVQEGKYERLPAKERFADAFAMNFLMPTTSIGRQIADKDIRRTDLFVLASYFGVSLQAITLRLEGLKYIPRGSWDELKSTIRDMGIRNVQEKLNIEPVTDSDELLPLRYQILAINAFQENQLSLGVFAQYMRMSKARARELFESSASMAEHEEEPLNE